MKLRLEYQGHIFRAYVIVLSDGSCPYDEFNDRLIRNDLASHRSLIDTIKRHADTGPINNKEKSRYIGGIMKLWEFKTRRGDRLLYSYLSNRRTVLITGFHKGTPAKREFLRAERILSQYIGETGDGR